MAEPLHLTVIPPKGRSHEALSVDPGMTGDGLKLRLQEALGFAAQAQVLHFQNGSRNAAKVLLEDGRPLAEQGVEDGATVSVRVNEAEVLPENSMLRQSIARNGGSSYYYAHANEQELPPELRYVYGGAPAKLGEAATPEAAAPREAPARAIKSYSWADEGDTVCIYVSAEAEAEALEAAGDGGGGRVTADFGPRSVELKVRGAAGDFALVLRNLEGEILAEGSRHRVSAGKRLTLRLRKRNPGTWTRLVRPQR
mmetsp:Transcript_65437/g.210975  ORF Transcript_65437/g.210975 Transcript_65437/m.210975 type:complete len:254 (-) Transcript_65437:140-901(-)